MTDASPLSPVAEHSGAGRTYCNPELYEKDEEESSIASLLITTTSDAAPFTRARMSAACFVARCGSCAARSRS
mgnify:CR=1 FL=1